VIKSSWILPVLSQLAILIQINCNYKKRIILLTKGISRWWKREKSLYLPNSKISAKQHRESIFRMRSQLPN